MERKTKCAYLFTFNRHSLTNIWEKTTKPWLYIAPVLNYVHQTFYKISQCEEPPHISLFVATNLALVFVALLTTFAWLSSVWYKQPRLKSRNCRNHHRDTKYGVTPQFEATQYVTSSCRNSHFISIHLWLNLHLIQQLVLFRIQIIGHYIYFVVFIPIFA